LFDIGLQEMLVIAVLVVLFFPPDDLPALFRMAGRGYAKMRRASDDLRRAFNAEVARVENEQRMEDVRRRREAAQRARDAAGGDAPLGPAMPPAGDDDRTIAPDPRLPPDAAPRRMPIHPPAAERGGGVAEGGAPPSAPASVDPEASA
jgi:sec-independent protein translocase protein TatB